MAVPKLRFKRDDGSEFPDWVAGKLGDITEKVDRKAPKGSVAPVMMISQGNGFIYQSEKYSRENAGQSLKNYTLLKKGEFAYNHGASKAKPYGVAYCLKEETEARVPFVYHTFKIINGVNSFWHESLNTNMMDLKLKRMVYSGVRMDGLLSINYATYMGANIHIPCLEEQQKIADFLGDVDTLIKTSEQELLKLKELKKGCLQKMFPRGDADVPEVRFPGFTGAWERRKLIECCDYVDYRGKTPAKTAEGVFLVTAKNVKVGYIDYEISKEYISEDDYDEAMHRGFPLIGDVLITTEAPCGNVAQVDREDIALAQRIIKYRGHENLIDNTYLKHYLLSPYFQSVLEAKSTGGTVQGIKGSVLHQQTIISPKYEEQQKIGLFLDSIDNLIAFQKRECEKYKELKKGLLQQMFV